MHPRVEAFLKRKREEEKSNELEKRNKLFKKLGLYTEKEVSYSEGYDRVAWVDGKPVYYKWEIAEVSDEEYNEILKYAKAESKEQSETPTKKPFNPSEIEDNGENYIMKFAKVWLIVLIAIATITCIVGIVVSDELFDFNWLMFLGYIAGSALTALTGFFVYFTIKVFANISYKSSAIYQLLKHHE